MDAAAGRALLDPASVAIIGASDDGTKTAGRPLRFLRAAGFAGRVYPVNPRRDTVLGERAWPSVASLPEVPEHAYIVAPTEAALEAVEECGRCGVRVATVLANGFSEAGAAGLAREERLRAAVRASGIRIVGPSSLGVVNVHARLLLTANAAFDGAELRPGSTFVASHSGSMIGALLSRGSARGLRFAGLVSVGNEADLGIGEVCAATLDDPRVGGYMLFLETLRHADSLRAFALAAAARGKAIVAYKLGRCAAAAELAVSHTGALAGEDDVSDAFLADCGIARMLTLDGLIEALPLVSKLRLKTGVVARFPIGETPVPSIGNRATTPVSVGVVTTTGGGAAMVVDQLGVRGVAVEPPSLETMQRLAAAGVEVPRGRIIDLTLVGTQYKVMKAALDVLLTAPEFAVIVAVPGSSARTEPQRAVQPIIDSAASATPLAAFVVPDAPQALAVLTAAGVPNFRTPEACADAIAGALSRRLRPTPPPSRPSPTPRSTPWAPAGEGELVDELAAYTLLSRLGIGHAAAEALDATSPATTTIVYPVAVKVLSAAIPHKTEAGGVELGVRDEGELRAAIDRIRASVASAIPCEPVTRVLVQAMVKGLGEALIGYRSHPQVGPMVIVAAGGVLTEIHRDRSIRMAPVDLETAQQMVAEVKAFDALRGFRGRPRGDLEALARAIVALSQLAVQDDTRVLEAEVNPLMILAEGVVAVDALVRLAR